jgi:hypothetical protein
MKVKNSVNPTADMKDAELLEATQMVVSSWCAPLSDDNRVQIYGACAR